MDNILTQQGERTMLIRLTALWAMNEAGLGGLMHLLRSPFTGIFVGGGAVLLIAMIGRTAKRPAAEILKALVLVLIIKAAVSPHSPLPAYLAVSFQGLLGALIFSVVPSFRLGALMLGTLALVEAAMQKLLVMTLLFGMPLWKALDAFVDGVLTKFNLLDDGAGARGSLWVVGAYVGVYTISGVLIGWLAGSLPEEVNEAAKRLTVPLYETDPASDAPQKKKHIFQKKYFQTMLLLAGILASAYFFSPKAWSGLASLWLVVRVFLLIGVWYLILGPMLMRLLQKFLKKKRSAYQEDVETALNLLPVFQVLARSAWRETSGLRGLSRIKELAIRIVTYALMYSKPAGR